MSELCRNVVNVQILTELTISCFANEVILYTVLFLIAHLYMRSVPARRFQNQFAAQLCCIFCCICFSCFTKGSDGVRQLFFTSPVCAGGWERPGEGWGEGGWGWGVELWGGRVVGRGWWQQPVGVAAHRCHLSLDTDQWNQTQPNLSLLLPQPPLPRLKSHRDGCRRHVSGAPTNSKGKGGFYKWIRLWAALMVPVCALRARGSILLINLCLYSMYDSGILATRPHIGGVNAATDSVGLNWLFCVIKMNWLAHLSRDYFKNFLFKLY